MKKLLVVAILLLVAGCGIQPTPVFQAGLAPTKSNSNTANLTLYFVSQGRVVPSTRATGTAVSPATALNLLLKGPSSAESGEQLYSELPLPTGEPITVDAQSYPVVVYLPFSLKELSSLAINQVVCTTRAALVTSGPVSTSGLDVILATTDGKLDPRPCQTF